MSREPLAAMFYLTEPARGIFVVNFRVHGELNRFEITRDQLANFLVDGTSMALRSTEFQHGAGSQSPASSASAPKPTPVPGADANISGEAT